MLYDEEYAESGAEEIHNNSDLDLPYSKYPQLVMP